MSDASLDSDSSLETDRAGVQVQPNAQPAPPPPKMQEEERGFSCSFCGKRFRRKYNMKVHELTHASPKERPFPCKFCPESFVQKSNYKRHLRTRHEKPMKCPRCALRFATKAEVSHHSRVAHPGQPELKVRERKGPSSPSFTCSCKRKFTSLPELLQHQTDCTHQHVAPSDPANTSAKVKSEQPGATVISQVALPDINGADLAAGGDLHPGAHKRAQEIARQLLALDAELARVRGVVQTPGQGTNAGATQSALDSSVLFPSAPPAGTPSASLRALQRFPSVPTNGLGLPGLAALQTLVGSGSIPSASLQAGIAVPPRPLSVSIPASSVPSLLPGPKTGSPSSTASPSPPSGTALKTEPNQKPAAGTTAVPSASQDGKARGFFPLIGALPPGYSAESAGSLLTAQSPLLSPATSLPTLPANMAAAIKSEPGVPAPTMKPVAKNGTLPSIEPPKHLVASSQS